MFYAISFNNDILKYIKNANQIFSQCTVHLLPVRSLSLTFTLVLRGFLSLSLPPLPRLHPHPTQCTRRALSFIEYIISYGISIIIASNNSNNDDVSRGSNNNVISF